MGIEGAVGELHFKVQVTRKETGAVEEYDVAGFVNADQLKKLQDEGVLPKPEGAENG